MYFCLFYLLLLFYTAHKASWYTGQCMLSPLKMPKSEYEWIFLKNLWLTMIKVIELFLQKCCSPWNNYNMIVVLNSTLKTCIMNTLQISLSTCKTHPEQFSNMMFIVAVSMCKHDPWIWFYKDKVHILHVGRSHYRRC